VQSGAEIVVAHVIQQAVAPVFLLTGVGAILSVLTNRLSRIIDRFRTLDALGVASRGPYTAGAAGAEDAEHHTIMQRRGEMKNLSRRRNWIHWAITSCTICALLICVVIATLFLASELGTDPSRLVGLLFVSAMLSLIGGLLCFLREIALATEQFEVRSVGR
jgi:hypothetical protein